MRLVAVGDGFEPREVVVVSHARVDEEEDKMEKVVLGRFPQLDGYRCERITFAPKAMDTSNSSGIGKKGEDRSILALSRNHCAFVYDVARSKKWHVLDLNSNNGVFVDGTMLPRCGMSAPLQTGSIIKLSKSVSPAVLYRFEELLGSGEKVEEVVIAQGGGVGEKQGEDIVQQQAKLVGILECARCHGLLKPPVAVLACGHCFCSETCLTSRTCSLCQTQSVLTKDMVGFAFRCDALDAILIKLLHQPSFDKPHSERFVPVLEEAERAQFHTPATKKPCLEQEADTVVLEARCSFCAEPAHERGTRCPHRKDEDDAGGEESESDLEEYV